IPEPARSRFPSRAGRARRSESNPRPKRCGTPSETRPEMESRTRGSGRARQWRCSGISWGSGVAIDPAPAPVQAPSALESTPSSSTLLARGCTRAWSRVFFTSGRRGSSMSRAIRARLAGTWRSSVSRVTGRSGSSRSTCSRTHRTSNASPRSRGHRAVEERVPRSVDRRSATPSRGTLSSTARYPSEQRFVIRSRPMNESTATLSPHAPVHETTLANGLKVLIQEVRSAPVVSFMVWYKVGSRNEGAGITGISHLLEHMMFKGTPKYGKGEIARRLQRNGASFNAGTSMDYTNYYEVLAADRLELAMEIESDRMIHALIPDEEHALEMTVVRSELERNEDNPHRALYTELFAHAFKAHPYHWPTIGWRS